MDPISTAIKRSLLGELQDIFVQLVEVWKYNTSKTIGGLEHNYERLQSLLIRQNAIASSLMDLGLEIGKDFKLFVPMDEALAM